MTGYFEIAPARAAGPALMLARFALVLLVVAGLSHRYGLLATPDFLIVSGVVFVIALFAALVWVRAFFDVWRKGRPGGRKLAAAAGLLLLVLSPFAAAIVMAMRFPALNDITTDRADPPQFFALDAFPRGKGAHRPGPLSPEPEVQERAYAGISGRRYSVSPDVVLETVEALFDERGWTPVRRRGAAQTDVEVWLETLAYTAVLRFAVDVALRLTDEGESTYVDMRSASHFGRRDFGENAARIGAFMADLDAAMLARAGG